jgi:hypothetical protein
MHPSVTKQDDQGGHGRSRDAEYGGQSQRGGSAAAGAIGSRTLVEGSLGADGQLRSRLEWARRELEAV